MGKLKDQLAGIAALIAAIVAIGGGFVKYGEITTKLAEIEGRSSTDYSSQIAVLEDKVAKCWLPNDVIFVSELPHTATCKLLKTNLRDEYKEHLINTGN